MMDIFFFFRNLKQNINSNSMLIFSHIYFYLFIHLFCILVANISESYLMDFLVDYWHHLFELFEQDSEASVKLGAQEYHDILTP